MTVIVKDLYKETEQKFEGSKESILLQISEKCPWAVRKLPGPVTLDDVLRNINRHQFFAVEVRE